MRRRIAVTFKYQRRSGLGPTRTWARPPPPAGKVIPVRLRVTPGCLDTCPGDFGAYRGADPKWPRRPVSLQRYIGFVIVRSYAATRCASSLALLAAWAKARSREAS